MFQEEKVDGEFKAMKDEMAVSFNFDGTILIS